MIQYQSLSGQVPQTWDAIICQISAPQAANPINFLRVACLFIVAETTDRCIAVSSKLKQEKKLHAGMQRIML